jgi:hypothetical protein
MVTLKCRACGEPITESDELSRWVHTDTESVGCDEADVTSGRAEPDFARVVSDAIDSLKISYTLSYVEQGDDGLTPQQIQAYLAGFEQEDQARDELLEYETDRKWASVQSILDELLDSDLYELLDKHGDLEQIRYEIEERDDSDLATQLLRQSGHALFRYRLDVSVPDYTMDDEQRATTRAEIAEAAGLDPTDAEVITKLDDLIGSASYGGELSVLWYGDPEDAVALARSTRWNGNGTENTDPNGTVTFTGAALLILNSYNGSGGDVDMPVITTEWAPRRVTLDHGPYSWSDVAAVHGPAYGANITINRQETDR